MDLPVLYDGWLLVYRPNSPAALHLLALLHACPPEVTPWLMLPDRIEVSLPERVRVRVVETPDTPRGRLRWEQRILPHMGLEVGARLLHLTTETAPLFSRLPCVLSPAEFGWPSNSPSPPGFWSRLREALSSGGAARLRALFWPEGIPLTVSGLRVHNLPVGLSLGQLESRAPGTSRDSWRAPLADLDLPQTYILYHGPQDKGSLRRLLDAWSWAAGSIGAYYPLVLVGFDRDGRALLKEMGDLYDLGESLRVLPELPPAALPALYRSGSALFHPAPDAPWGSPLRLALFSGLAVVALADPRSDALVGPAAYLVPEGDARAMGAALVTVIVEESVADRLSTAALQRASAWRRADFGAALLSAYRACLEAGA